MKITTNLPPNKTLNPGDLHVWVTSLQCTPVQLAQLIPLLSPEEFARSQRFKMKKAQEQFIVGRAVLRKILGEYLQLEPEKILFTYEKFGKPMLDESIQHVPELAFNLSHSQGLALYALANTTCLGADLEYRGREHFFDEIAERFFSAKETEEIKTARGENKKISFYNIWTKKEALLKALGLGLHGPLKQFTVHGIEQGKIEELKALPFDSTAQSWHVFSLDYDSNFSVSIAMNQKPQNIWLNYRKI